MKMKSEVFTVYLALVDFVNSQNIPQSRIVSIAIDDLHNFYIFYYE